MPTMINETTLSPRQRWRLALKHSAPVAMGYIPAGIAFGVLMSAAVIGAVAIGQYEEAASVAFLYAVSELLESWTMDKARRSLRELIELLGGPAAEAVNTLYQSIIDGKAAVSIELLQQVRAEAEKNLHDPLLIDAVNVLIAQVNEMVGTAE